jgi:hypothetical protein
MRNRAQIAAPGRSIKDRHPIAQARGSFGDVQGRWYRALRAYREQHRALGAGAANNSTKNYLGCLSKPQDDLVTAMFFDPIWNKISS